MSRQRFHLHYLSEFGDEIAFALEGDAVIVEEQTFFDIPDYTNSIPTSPSPGRVYKKNLGGTWWFYLCKLDPDDNAYVLHHPYRLLIA